MKELFREVTLEEWIAELGRKDLAGLLIYLGMSILGYAVVGLVIVLLDKETRGEGWP